MFTISDPYPIKSPSRSASEAAAKRAAKEAEAEAEAAEAAVAAPVRRGPPPSHRVYPQTTASACAHPVVYDGLTTARTVADGPLYGPRHTRMSVSSLAEAVTPHDACHPCCAGSSS